jgi:hypothetical protein
VVIPSIAGAEQGLKEGGFRGRVSSQAVGPALGGVQNGQEVGILVLMDLVACPKGGYSNMVLV